MQTLLKGLAVAILFSYFATLNSFAQQETGTISGNISDSVETVIGAVVVVEGNNTLGAFTDTDGNFTIKNIKPGTYAILVTYFGYKPLKVENVQVEAGKNTEMGNVYMKIDATESQEVIVVGTKTTNTEESAVRETKESKEVINVISAEQISKSQDRDAAQVMQRIPGVTLIQNRFIMVRGLSERYNSVLLNGAVAPSSEADTKAFSFDLIPSNMIDRVTVYKSGSYDQPADFAGSVVRIYTRNSLDENVTQLSVTGGYRSGTTFKSFSRMEQFGSDALGFGAGKRDFPSDFPAKVTDPSLTGSMADVEKVEAQSEAFANNWNIKKSSAYPDGRLNFLIGRKFNLGSVRVSSINNLSYSNTRQYAKIDRNSYWNYTTNNESSVKEKSADQYYSNDVRLGVLSNWSFVLSPNHKIDFRNMFSQLASSDVIERSGYNNEKSSEFEFYSLRYSANGIFSSPLQGSHTLNKDKTKLLWLLGYANIARKEPDWRRYSYQRALNSNDAFTLVTPSNASATDNARFFTNLKENGFSGNLELEQKLVKNADSSGVSVKVGVFVDYKSREYYARWMSYAQGTSFDNSQAATQVSDVQSNIDYFTGYTLREGTRPTDKYSAEGFLMAYYAGLNIPFLKKFNLSTGARMESYNQKLSDATSSLVDTNVTRLLPSANLSYNFTKKMLVRFGYARTLNRPEFRELSPFAFYDFNLKTDKVGNPDLKTADIHNFDLRAEYYPSSDEMIAVGVFYKRFLNPIEVYQVPTGSNPAFRFGNGKEARSQGVELEIRKSLGFISTGSVMEQFSLLFNGALIISEIRLDTVGNTSSLQIDKRQMQGQSPYVINTGVYFNSKKSGWQASLMYNVFGPRIFAVGDQQIRTMYEMQRHLLDLTVTKNITDKLSIRAGIADILNSNTRVMEDGNGDGKLNNTAVDKSIYTFQTGQYFNLGFNYKF